MSKKMDVTITAYRDPAIKPDGIGFRMAGPDIDPKQPDTLKCDKTAAGMGKHEDHHVTFELRNDKGSDLRFLKDKDEVMWTAPETASGLPDCPCNSGCDGDFTVTKVTNDRLELNNANSRACKHKFVLNFIGTNAQGKTGLIQYDPIWDNKDGGTS